MRDNTGSETDAPDTDSAGDSPTVSTLRVRNETVLFDIDDKTRWIQSDTAVALKQIA